MWISKRTDYATRVVLALAIDDGAGPISAEELARRVAAPPSVVEQVMPVLRTAGIVRSERGAHGGYKLNKAPAEIVLERVVRLFEGQLAPIGCATRSHPEPCPMSVECSLRFVWEDVRDRMIDVISRVGGHFAPGLGVVELTIALHYVFNTPADRIIWDVGHQGYPHKILTGRNATFDAIRQKDGPSGFLSRKESEYDVFGAGHASTATSR